MKLGWGEWVDPKKQVDVWYRKYGEQVWRRCRYYLRDGHAAWDATQDTFMKAFTAIDTLRENASVLAWLLTIADRTCLNKIRSSRGVKGRMEVLDHEDGDTGGVSLSFEGQVIARHVAIRVLSEMPDELRDVGVMRHMDGMRVNEIAEALGIAEKTVARRLARFMEIAMQRLQLQGSEM